MKFGFPHEQWNARLEEAIGLLRRRAKARSLLTYSELSRELGTINIGYHDYAMDHLFR